METISGGKLASDRMKRAVSIFAEIWLEDRSVDEEEDWTVEGNKFSKVVYLRGEEDVTKLERAVFTIDFMEHTSFANGAQLDGRELNLPAGAEDWKEFI